MRLIVVWLMAAAVLTPTASKLVAGAEPPSQEQVRQWVEELDADDYDLREQATKRLIRAGAAAVPAVADAAPTASLEAATRIVSILREIALIPKAEAQEAAREALQALAESRVTTSARRAASALHSLDLVRQERAIRELRSLGAKVIRRSVQIGVREIPGVLDVEIGDKWQGESTDLYRLTWLTDMQCVTLIGELPDADWLRHIGKMTYLLKLSLNRTDFPSSALEFLGDLDQLREIEIKYSPIDDGALEHLRVCDDASTIKLYGTKVSKEGAERLAKNLERVKVDWRQGAFLGVGCQPHPMGCLVAIVHPGSAAERAGVTVGDVIVSYDGKKTPDFETLTRHISQNQGGDRVTIQMFRAGQTFARTLTLGEWD